MPNTMNLIDTALDRSIALGHGDLGRAIRRRLPGWPTDPPRMDGRVVLVTGAASGIGLAACQGFARLGATVRPLARSELRAREAADAIASAVPEASVSPLACDLSDLARRRAGAHRAGTDHHGQLGRHVQPADARRRSGVCAHAILPVEGVCAHEAPAGGAERDVGERLATRGTVAHAMHPGWVETPGLARSLPGVRSTAQRALRDPAGGADTIVWLGGAPEALESTGRFWHDRRPRPTHYLLGAPEDPPQARQELWDYCETAIS